MIAKFYFLAAGSILVISLAHVEAATQTYALCDNICAMRGVAAANKNINCNACCQNHARILGTTGKCGGYFWSKSKCYCNVPSATQAPAYGPPGPRRPQGPGGRFQAPGARPQPPVARPQAPGARYQTPFARPQAPGARPQAPGARFQAQSNSDGGSGTCLMEVNEVRQSNRMNALQVHPQLVQTAKTHNAVMIKYNCYEHNCPGEPILGTRARLAGYKYRTFRIGETLLAGNWNSCQRAMKDWLESPTHRAELLRPEYTYLGYDIATSTTGKTDWRFYYTCNYACIVG